MVLGVPREIKKEEYRVGVTPGGAVELRRLGHTVLVEEGAGSGSGFADAEYLEADADIVDRGTLYRKADLVVKVKEPLPEEYGLLRAGQAIFTYLHLAPNPALTGVLLEKRITSLAYETLEDEEGLPLLAPMSEIAGRMAPLMGAYYLQRPRWGEGVFPAGAVGVEPARCVIFGAGVVGANAARVAQAIGMETVVLNRGVERLRKLDELFNGQVGTLPLTQYHIARSIKRADIVVGAILVPGGRTPVLVTREMLRTMKRGSVVLDVSVDQGGCFETTRPTTHENPVYEEEGVIHYTVANMPGAYPRTSTLALTNSSLPYIARLLSEGVEAAIAKDGPMRSALNTYRGKVVHPGLARALGAEPADIDALLSTKPLP
jgi:alanine dehydrogenase